jgi:KDO2-lipid IV(A) lauroyltransferase
MALSRKYKRKIKRIKAFFSKIVSFPAKPLFYVMSNVPSSVVKSMAEVFGFLFWHFGFPWRRMAIGNIRLIYKDELSNKEIKRIAKESMKNIVRMMVEGAIIYKPPYSVIENTPIEGEEYLKEALKRGKGVLALGSHVGHFLLLICVLSKRGYPFSFVFKEPSEKGFSEFVWEIMKGLKLDPIPLKPRSIATKRSISTLRKNGILWLALDQGTRDADVGVEFFGIKTATARGPAILSTRTGAAVIPMYVKWSGWL